MDTPKNKKALLLRYARLSAENKRSRQKEPTEEMREIAQKLNLTHTEIITEAAKIIL